MLKRPSLLTVLVVACILTAIQMNLFMSFPWKNTLAQMGYQGIERERLLDNVGRGLGIGICATALVASVSGFLIFRDARRNKKGCTIATYRAMEKESVGEICIVADSPPPEPRGRKG